MIDMVRRKSALMLVLMQTPLESLIKTIKMKLSQSIRRYYLSSQSRENQNLFPRLSSVTCFPALVAGCTVSRAFQRCHVYTLRCDWSIPLFPQLRLAETIRKWFQGCLWQDSSGVWLICTIKAEKRMLNMQQLTYVLKLRCRVIDGRIFSLPFLAILVQNNKPQS